MSRLFSVIGLAAAVVFANCAAALNFTTGRGWIARYFRKTLIFSKQNIWAGIEISK
jgi:hypothetical protein